MGISAPEKGAYAYKEGPGAMIQPLKIFLFPVLLLMLFAAGCSSKAKTSYLIRDMENPPRVIQDTFSIKGKSDYILLNDGGYSYRLVYLCENRVYNFAEEPARNFLLISLQPILDTSVEEILSADDRRRIWACLERKVQEEQSRAEEAKRRIAEERSRLQGELQTLQMERARILAELGERKRLEEENQRKIEAELRRMEEERQRRAEKAEEELRRKEEEERKIKFYGTWEKEKEPSPQILPQIKASETGIFLVMKEADLHEDPRFNAKILGQGKKYDVFDVLQTRKDKHGVPWHQVVIKDRLVSSRVKRHGWTPEERAFWVKHKLPIWVYPGDPSRTGSAKTLRFNVEEVQFTGKRLSSPDKNTLYEVAYELNVETTERILAWIEERNGIRRKDKNADEMRTLLKELAYTLWPILIQNDILKGTIREGFTPQQVTFAWGKPDHINKKHTLVGVLEQWVYGETPFPNAYVYFENGVVKNWEFLKSGPKQ